jgi:hypothetical protein
VKANKNNFYSITFLDVDLDIEYSFSVHINISESSYYGIKSDLAALIKEACRASLDRIAIVLPKDHKDQVYKLVNIFNINTGRYEYRSSLFASPILFSSDNITNYS